MADKALYRLTHGDVAAHRQRVAWLETVRDRVVAIAAHYPPEHHVPPHHHSRAQLLHIANGVIMVQTASGRWMVPPGHAVWIPAGVEHWLDMLGAVSMQSVYVTQGAGAPLSSGLVVVGLTPLMEALLPEAVAADVSPAEDSRDAHVLALLLDEISRLPSRSLGLPFPSDPRLSRLCHAFVRHPSPRTNIDDWADRLGMSRRSFTRAFHRQTGMSLALWRQQACLLAALPRLTDGESITNVAVDLGYESVPAFTTMFKRMLGAPPSLYMRRQ
ncbi:AraC family transcriptional regulator [Agaricicola taiwanensis]|uniref:AraC family transcriptional regulator n=1 Tax=Agaricicola taiwanensis TaxID=591372 RepID=A0A8J3DXC7_9RHOB|nr:helix-turn-helix transcriptional regulator [Agaricicola taiwanensis]GGE47944.1 AraC family transcriptional regulator [Agaricicola taiwanensis]